MNKAIIIFFLENATKYCLCHKGEKRDENHKFRRTDQNSQKLLAVDGTE